MLLTTGSRERQSPDLACQVTSTLDQRQETTHRPTVALQRRAEERRGIA
jgi:hypothetical protein